MVVDVNVHCEIDSDLNLQNVKRVANVVKEYFICSGHKTHIICGN